MDDQFSATDIVGLPQFYVTEIVSITSAGGTNMRIIYGERRSGILCPVVEFIGTLVEPSLQRCVVTKHLLRIRCRLPQPLGLGVGKPLL